MNLPSIVNTLAALGGGAPAGTARAAQQQAPGAFGQMLSREVAQRSPAPPGAQPRPASQQPARPQEAARAQPARTQAAERPAAAQTPEQAPAATEAAASATAQAAEAPAEDRPAGEQAVASLADIPGAPQAALIMQLMSSATAATAATPAQEAAVETAPAVAGKAGRDAAAMPPFDPRAEIAAADDGQAAAGQTRAQAAAPDLHAAFGRAMAEAAGQRPAQAPAAVQGEAPAAAPAAALATMQSAIQNVHAPAGHVDRLTPAVGTPAWDQALGQKIVWMAQGGEMSASLTMNPPDLGPMQVVLSVSNNQASVDFMAAQPEVREALESALPRLKEMMSESGIQLGQANVSAGGGQQFAGSGGGSRGGARAADPASGEAMPQPRQGVVRMARDGAVDTFA